jgi:hypothetical protein
VELLRDERSRKGKFNEELCTPGSAPISPLSRLTLAVVDGYNVSESKDNNAAITSGRRWSEWSLKRGDPMPGMRWDLLGSMVRSAKGGVGQV